MFANNPAEAEPNPIPKFRIEYGMREFEAYDKKRYFLSGASVGELGSSTQAKEEWFSKRHSKVRAQPDFPRSKESPIGSKLKPDFPM